MLITKDAIPILSIGFMNDVHDEDRKIINDIYELILKYEKVPSHNNKENIGILFQKWFNHTVKHFSNEENRMLEEGFPLYKSHKNEHKKALTEMHLIFSDWQESNDINILKSYFEDVLPKWIVQHIETMDLIAAQFFEKE